MCAPGVEPLRLGSDCINGIGKLNGFYELDVLSLYARLFRERDLQGNRGVNSLMDIVVLVLETFKFQIFKQLVSLVTTPREVGLGTHKVMKKLIQKNIVEK